MSEKSLQSVLHENRLFPAPAALARSAYPDTAELARLREHASRDPEGFWAEQARAGLQWQQPFTQVLDATRAPNFRWFTDGKLNVSWNCLDAQLATRRDAPALIFEAEGGAVRRLSYGEL